MIFKDLKIKKIPKERDFRKTANFRQIFKKKQGLVNECFTRPCFLVAYPRQDNKEFYKVVCFGNLQNIPFNL
jgi:hypothetical protein